MSAMRIEFHNTLDDLLDWNVEHLKQSRTGRATRLKAALFPAVFVLLIVGIIAIVEINLWIALASLALSLAAGAGAYQGYLRAARKGVARFYAEGKNEGMIGRHSLTIDEQYLRETSPRGSQDVLLSGIERIIDTQEAVYIYISAASAHVVPRRSVIEGDLDAFVRELRARTKPKVRSRDMGYTIIQGHR